MKLILIINNLFNCFDVDASLSTTLSSESFLKMPLSTLISIKLSKFSWLREDRKLVLISFSFENDLSHSTCVMANVSKKWYTVRVYNSEYAVLFRLYWCKTLYAHVKQDLQVFPSSLHVETLFPSWSPQSSDSSCPLPTISNSSGRDMTSLGYKSINSFKLRQQKISVNPVSKKFTNFACGRRRNPWLFQLTESSGIKTSESFVAHFMIQKSYLQVLNHSIYYCVEGVHSVGIYFIQNCFIFALLGRYALLLACSLLWQNSINL